VEKIRLFKPQLSNEAIAAVTEVLKEGWLGLGSRTEEFEKAFAQFIGAPYCIGLNSGTSALHLVLRLLNLPPGSEVITTALTFVSTNHVLLYEKLLPVFSDVQIETGNIDVKSIREKLTPRTKAIMIVHYGGYPCDLNEIYALGKEYGIPVVEDCAHACGATYRGKRIGSLGSFQAFSFNPVKNLPMGDGGALIVKSSNHNQKLKRLRWLGINKNTYHTSRSGKRGGEHEVIDVGFKYHMNDINAAIGLCELRNLENNNRRRKEIAQKYKDELRKVKGITLLKYKKDRDSSNHLFCFLADNRNDLVNKLLSMGIETGVHYKRNDLYPMYRTSNLPNTEYFSNAVISLPMHLELTDEQIHYIVNQIKRGW